MKAKIVTPTLTIFNQEGAIDYEGNRTLIRHLVDNGVDGVVPLGSTGEFTILPFEEKKRRFSIIMTSWHPGLKEMCTCIIFLPEQIQHLSRKPFCACCANIKIL